jgi:phosphatidylinositol alpha-mannosyltransferase
MKIIVTSYYLPPVDRIGAGVQMHMIANEYCKLGHDVIMLSPSHDKDNDALYELVSVEIKGKNRILKWSLFLANHKFDADLVHFSGDDFLVRNGSDYVHLRTFMGSCLAEARVAKQYKDKIRMTYLGLTEVVSSLRFSTTTVISESTNRYLCRNGLLIPCGVDLRSFRPGSEKSHNPTILFVGTLDSRKQGRLLVNAFVEVVQKRIPHAELWIVREPEKLTIPGVTSFGSVTQGRLIELYQRAWVFCLPSSYEGFGVPYIEAMACGTPVVATPNPGALEVLDGGRYGLLTDIDQLGNTLVSLLSDEIRRADLSIRGLDRARDYDIRKVAKMYIDFATDFAEKRVWR